MKRLIALLVVPAVALVPSTALGKPRAKTYKGTFNLVGANGDYVTGNFGKVQLVDSKRNDKLSVHVRQLAAKTNYTYALQTGTCKAGAPGGVDVAGFKYKPLKTNRSGNGNSTARSKTFTAQRGVKYKVVVYAGGEVALCAQLRTNGSHSNGKHDDKGKDHGKSGHADKPKGNSDGAPGQAKDKSTGKSDDAPGQNKDKSTGKSDDAPGQSKDKPSGKGGD
jgi:hypothetical protein